MLQKVGQAFPRDSAVPPMADSIWRSRPEPAIHAVATIPVDLGAGTSDRAADALDGGDGDAVWLVTGATHHIGRFLADAALRRHLRVVATASRLQDLSPLVDRHGGAVLPVELDVNDEGAIREVVDSVVDSYGRIDVVVNNAGYDADRAATPRSALEGLQSNLFGALWASRAASAHMQTAGGHIAQVLDLDRHADRAVFDRGRRVLTNFSGRLADELAPFGIKVTICVPAEPDSSSPRLRCGDLHSGHDQQPTRR